MSKIITRIQKCGIMKIYTSRGTLKERSSLTSDTELFSRVKKSLDLGDISLEFSFNE